MSEAGHQPDRKARPTVTLASVDPRENQARDQLLRLLERYDLEKWQLTDAIQIDRMAIPHSMPVLTLNARYVDDDHRALAAYLHEQLHWFAPGWRREVGAAMQELRQRFPVVPTFEAGGARGETSTYLHLVVCPLEYASLIEVIGVDAARATLAGYEHYTWLYATVLRDWSYFADLLGRHGLELGDAPLQTVARPETPQTAFGVGGEKPRLLAEPPIALGLQLYVLDLHVSADFYARALGFEIQYTRPTGRHVQPTAESIGSEPNLEYVSLRSGRVFLALARWAAIPEGDYLRRGPADLRGLGMEFIIEVDDAPVAEHRVLEAGFTVESPCRRRPWGATDFRVIDPDGYYLRIMSRL